MTGRRSKEENVQVHPIFQKRKPFNLTDSCLIALKAWLNGSLAVTIAHSYKYEAKDTLQDGKKEKILLHTNKSRCHISHRNPKSVKLKHFFAGTFSPNEDQILVPETSRSPHQLLSKCLHTQECQIEAPNNLNPRPKVPNRSIILLVNFQIHVSNFIMY